MMSEKEINKLMQRTIILEKILVDNGEDTMLIAGLKVAYLEKHKVLGKDAAEYDRLKDFAEDYIVHLKDMIKMKYKNLL